MEKGNNRATNREKARQIAYHDKTYKLDTEQTAVTTIIMKPPGQNRVTTMKETLTDSSQLERWVGRRWYRQWQTATRKLVHDNHVTRPPAHQLPDYQMSEKDVFGSFVPQQVENNTQSKVKRKCHSFPEVTDLMDV